MHENKLRNEWENVVNISTSATATVHEDLWSHLQCVILFTLEKKCDNDRTLILATFGSRFTSTMAVC